MTKVNLVKGGKQQAQVMALEDARALKALSDSLLQRAQLGDRLGKSYWGTSGAARNLYTALGYTENPTFGDYWGRYRRQDVARRIIDAPVNACWRLEPNVIDEGGEETAFEKAWKEMVDRVKVFHYFSRLDKLSGVGEYAVLFLGFDDGNSFDNPMEGQPKSRKLLYLFPYSMEKASVAAWATDPANERYGLPLVYKVDMRNAQRTGGITKRVHHSRILHVSEFLLDDDVYGMPKLEPVLNRLQDLEMLSGGSAEMFWRGAFPGMTFNLDADADAQTLDLDDIKEQIELYMHSLKRYLRLQGVEAKQLMPSISSPKDHMLSLIHI